MKCTRIILCLLLSMLRCFNLTGCFGKRYTIDFGDADGLFEGAKKSYRVGQTVKLYFPYVLTDTDYTFYLDGERFYDYEYDPRKGFIFEFKMPDHDITLTMDTYSSMTALVYPEE